MSGIITRMSNFSFANQYTIYTVQTPLYEGPLDFLLQLIEKAELDITKLALSLVTDQYLEYLHNSTKIQPEDVSSFLVIAAKLVLIKSQSLLPTISPQTRDEEDLGDTLARQLIVYKKFKEIGNHLALIESSNLHTYSRIGHLTQPESRLDINSLSLSSLIETARTVLNRLEYPTEINIVVPGIKVTVREKIDLISRFINSKQRGKFWELFRQQPYRIEVVITFLALLEMVKRQLISAQQSQLFGEIEFEASNNWNKESSFETEF